MAIAQLEVKPAALAPRLELIGGAHRCVRSDTDGWAASGAPMPPAPPSKQQKKPASMIGLRVA